MKKLLSLLVMMIVAITISAETYQCHFDVNAKSTTKLTISVNSSSLSVGSNTYTLRQLGTITNSGVTFKSYVYSSSERMFCVSTSQVTLQLSPVQTVTGYVIMIDNHTYLARKTS